MRRAVVLGMFGMALAAVLALIFAQRTAASTAASLESDGPHTYEFRGQAGLGGGFDTGAIPINTTIGGDGAVQFEMDHIQIQGAGDSVNWNFPFAFEVDGPPGAKLSQTDDSVVSLNVHPRTPDSGTAEFFGGLGLSVTIAGTLDLPFGCGTTGLDPCSYPFDKAVPDPTGLSVFNSVTDDPPGPGETLDVPKTQCYLFNPLSLILPGQLSAIWPSYKFGFCHHMQLGGAEFTADVQLVNATCTSLTGAECVNGNELHNLHFDLSNPIQAKIHPTGGGPVQFHFKNFSYQPTLADGFKFYVEAAGTTVYTSPFIRIAGPDTFDAVTTPFPKYPGTPLTAQEWPGYPQPTDIELDLDEGPSVSSIVASKDVVEYGEHFTLSATVDDPNNENSGIDWSYSWCDDTLQHMGDGTPYIDKVCRADNIIANTPLVNGVATIDPIDYGNLPVHDEYQFKASYTYFSGGGPTATFSKISFFIRPRTLHIGVQDASRRYGDLNPTFQPTYSGFLGTDGPWDLSSLPQFATDAVPTSHVGDYDVTPSGDISAANYAIVFDPGILHVTPRPTPVEVVSTSKTYGAPLPDFQLSFPGQSPFDTSVLYAGTPGFTTTASVWSAVGSYPVMPGGISSPDYTFTFKSDGVLTVTPAPLTISATATSVYGDPVPQPTPTYTGFVLGQGPSVLRGSASYTVSASSTSAAGTYPITVSGNQQAANYAVQYAAGTLTITKRPLQVNVAPATKTYGAPLPSFVATYDGFVNGDGPSVLSGTVQFATQATAASRTGTYLVWTHGTLTAQNYDAVYGSNLAGLVITPTPLKIQPATTHKSYGAPVPSVGLTYSGFVLGEGASVLSGSPVFTHSVTTASPVGTYSVSVSGLSSPNYAIQFVAGSLVVDPATLTVGVQDVSKDYGAPLPAFTLTYRGFVLGEGTEVVHGTATFTTSATARSDAGSYPVTPGGLSADNYALVFQPGTLTITPIPTTVAVSYTPVPAYVDRPVSLVALVNSAAGPANGAVTLTLDGAVVGSSALDASGRATLPVGLLAVGSHAVTAQYTGARNFLPQTGAGTVDVRKIPTKLVVQPALLKVASGGLRLAIDNLTGTLTDARTGSPLAGQVITFSVNGATVCSATTDASGVATCSGTIPYVAAALNLGFDAAYAGDATRTESAAHGPLVQAGGVKIT
jgi:plastocyanin